MTEFDVPVSPEEGAKKSVYLNKRERERERMKRKKERVRKKYLTENCKKSDDLRLFLFNR